MMAIFTKYVGPTNHRGSKVRAWADWGDNKKIITSEWDDGLDSEGNHDAAAQALAHKLDWAGRWYRGGAECGNVYVRVDGGTKPVFHVKRDWSK